MSDLRSTFDRAAMARVCTMAEHRFGAAYGLDVTKTDHPAPENFYFFRDHGSRVLAVAHLDTVGKPDERACRFVDTEAGEVVFSRALDDRLGAYIILEWLPAMGIQYDILLTVGEESGMSTASDFVHPDGKVYDWIIEFDRGGTDVVMYQYDDDYTRHLVERCGAVHADGIFSDISYLEHLGTKAFNWGVGYRDYHGPKAHAYLEDTYEMIGYFLTFHEQNYGTRMPHEKTSRSYGSSRLRDDDYYFDWDSGWSTDARRRRSTIWGLEDDDDEDVVFDPADDDYDELWRQPDALDEDWIEYPTLEQMQQFQEAEDRLADRERA